MSQPLLGRQRALRSPSITLELDNGDILEGKLNEYSASQMSIVPTRSIPVSLGAAREMLIARAAEGSVGKFSTRSLSR
jgi:hypothetical protein